MAKIMTDSVHYESIADSLRQTTGSADRFMPSQMAAGIMGAFDAGKQSQWNMLWDAIMNGGHLTQEKAGIFCGNHWNDANFYPKYDIVPFTGTYLFKDCRITDLKGRLEEAVRQYGSHRLVLSLHRIREDFFLPAPTGRGRPLSQRELEQRLRQLEPRVFFSKDLCAHYFTYMSRETGAHFVLFDDGESLKQKRALAQEAGIPCFFWLYPELESLLPDFSP